MCWRNWSPLSVFVEPKDLQHADELHLPFAVRRIVFARRRGSLLPHHVEHLNKHTFIKDGIIERIDRAIQINRTGLLSSCRGDHARNVVVTYAPSLVPPRSILGQSDSSAHELR